MVGDGEVKMPGTDWADYLATRKMSYEGEAVAKAEDLTLEQIAPALPPKGLAGSVDALDLCTPAIKEQLLDPSLSVVPVEQWPERFPKSRVRVKAGEWVEIAKHLIDLDICIALEEGELVYHNGRPLTNGAFGVSKGKQFWSDKQQKMVDVLRLIISLVPSNSIQTCIPGDIATLPHAVEVS